MITKEDTTLNQNTVPHLVHIHDVHLDDDYTQWLVELKTRYRSAQITAAVKVNAEKLLFNWQLGRDLVLKKAEERWGTGVVEQVSLDLHAEFPNDKGFSTRNLWYMKQWYEFYTREPQFLQRVVAEIQIPDLKLQRAVAEIPAAFACVPWGQHIEIFTQCETIDETIIPRTQTQNESQIVLYQPDDSIRLEVKIDADNETVWLNRNQIAELFGRDVKTIGKHINNALREELAPITEANATDINRSDNPSVAKFATVQTEGGREVTRQVEYYNLDVILSVGYRVKSNRGIQFRRWSNTILKQYLLQGYSINRHLVALQERTDQRFANIEQRLDNQQKQIDFFIRTNVPPVEGIFYEGQVLDARLFAEQLIHIAQREVILIDNYIDSRSFDILELRNPGVEATIYVERIGRGLQSLQQTAQTQTGRIVKLAETRQRVHDRFLIIDDEVYHLGASLNELGKRLFAFSRLQMGKEIIMQSIINQSSINGMSAIRPKRMEDRSLLSYK